MQQVDDLEIALYSTLTGRPRVGDNQFEVKLRNRQGQPVSQADVEVAYTIGSMGHAGRKATRPEGFGIFSTGLNFPMAGTWTVQVVVFTRLKGYLHVLHVGAGLLLMAMGVLLLTGYLTILNSYAIRLTPQWLWERL